MCHSTVAMFLVKLLEQEMKKEEERNLLAEEEMKKEEQCRLLQEEEMKKEEARRLLEEETKTEEQAVNKEVVIESADTKLKVNNIVD